MNKRYLFLLISVLILSISCAEKTVDKESFNLTFIVSTDIHGAIFPYDFMTGLETDHSMAHLSTVLKDLRLDEQNEVIYLDSGDYYQGQPVIYYNNFLKDGKNLGASVLNYLEADAGVVGNHDIEVGQDVYDKLTKEMEFPYLAANALRKDDTNKTYFEPYTIINRNGFKIAVIGMVTPRISDWLPEVLWKEMYFEDIVESSKKWIKIVQEKETPDFIVGVFHSGLGDDNNEPMSENAALYTALNVDGFDIIFEGHDHQASLTNVVSPSGKNVLVMGALDAMRSVSKAVVSVKKENNEWVIGQAEGIVVDIQGSDIVPDEEFLKKFDADFKEAKVYLSDSVGALSETITSHDAIFGPSKFVDLIHQLQFKIVEDNLGVKADISFTAPLSVDASLNEGDISYGNLFSLYRYENWLYVMELTGAEIKDYLEYNYDSWVATMTSPDSYMLAYVYNDDGSLVFNERYNTYDTKTRFYNFDTAVGIDYTVDLTKGLGNRINIIGFSDGREFDDNTKYKVAINSYRGNGGGGHLTEGAGILKEELPARIIAATDKDLRYYLGESIREAKVLTPPLYNNWKFIPENFASKAKEREYEMWFPKNNIDKL